MGQTLLLAQSYQPVRFFHTSAQTSSGLGHTNLVGSSYKYIDPGFHHQHEVLVPDPNTGMYSYWFHSPMQLPQNHTIILSLQLVHIQTQANQSSSWKCQVRLWSQMNTELENSGSGRNTKFKGASKLCDYLAPSFLLCISHKCDTSTLNTADRMIVLITIPKAYHLITKRS